MCDYYEWHYPLVEGHVSVVQCFDVHKWVFWNFDNAGISGRSGKWQLLSSPSDQLFVCLCICIYMYLCVVYLYMCFVFVNLFFMSQKWHLLSSPMVPVPPGSV